MTTIDDNLRRVLDRVSPNVASNNISEKITAVSSVVRDYSDFIPEVFECLKSHSELSFEGQLFFDSAQLHIHPYSGAISLIAYAVEYGSQSAINWYRDVISTQFANIRHACLVSGITSKEKLDFSNGISILPLDDAGESAQVMRIRQIATPNPLQFILGSHFNALAVKDAEYKRTETIPNPPASHQFVAAVEDVLVGSILNGGLAPAMLVHWEEFLDPDLRAAETSWGASGLPQEAPVTSGRLLTKDDVPNIELFLSQEGTFREKLRVALVRIGLARRKHDIANKAIEYSIALESMLGDGNAEMTHKIATRAAIILGQCSDKRIMYRKFFKKLYKIRSLAVHGQKVSQSDQIQVVKDSDTAVAQLLLIAAKQGKAFDFDKLDLSAEV